MGYTEEEFSREYPFDNLENIYSIKVKLSQSVLNKIQSPIRNEEWWLIIIKDKNESAKCYNKTLDKRYNLIKE